MTAQQFDVLVKLLRSRSPARDAARLVLVEGVTPTDAAVACGMSRSAVSNALSRFRAAHASILTAYSANTTAK
jgi:DNA-directed RNA polymerase specialized sigma24 family protein